MSEAANSLWWEKELQLEASLQQLLEDTLVRLRAAHERGRFPQSLLIIGPRGLGREWVVNELAALLCCPQGGGACSCSSCARVRRGVHPDVQLLRPEGAGQQIKIASVREVVAAVNGRPFEARRRIWIFDGVERTSFGAEAANAFLKTLEEPPEHVVFMLLAANPSAVLSTILSRCQSFILPGPVAVAQKWGDGNGLAELIELSCGGGLAVEEEVERLQQALRELATGQCRGVLEWTHRLGNEPGLFQLAAAAALDLGVRNHEDDAAPRRVQLAAELLRTEQRCRALNLSRRRQLLACLLRGQLPGDRT